MRRSSGERVREFGPASDDKSLADPRYAMVRKSTVVIFIGIVFLFIPIPPIATAIGIVTILLGIALRLLGGS